MRALVANTDFDWYRFLSADPSIDEVNFWRPSGQRLNALSYGEPLIFKLRKAQGHHIVGFGLFVAFRPLQVREAWESFGRGNGAATLGEMWSRISKLALRTSSAPFDPLHRIGAILLASPVFFPQGMWVDAPGDWANQIVAGKGYDTTVGEGRRIWRDCLQRAAHVAPALLIDPGAPAPATTADPAARYGVDRLVRHRLGQATFRVAVEDAYGIACAVTNEHSRPALEAAHIQPYTEGGPHEIPNGLLLRADLHRLFDAGYVSVTPDLQFRVSDRLRADFSNGRSYYPLDRRPIATPTDARFAPDRERLALHFETRFLR